MINEYGLNDLLNVLVIDDVLHHSSSLTDKNLDFVSFDHEGETVKHVYSLDSFNSYYKSMGTYSGNNPDIVVIDRDFSRDVSAPILGNQSGNSVYDSRGLLYGSQIISRLMNNTTGLPFAFHVYSGDMNGLDNDGLGKTLFEILNTQQSMVIGGKPDNSYSIDLRDAIGKATKRYRRALMQGQLNGEIQIDLEFDVRKIANVFSGDFVYYATITTERVQRRLSLASLFFDLSKITSRRSAQAVRDWCEDILKIEKSGLYHAAKVVGEEREEEGIELHRRRIVGLGAGVFLGCVEIAAKNEKGKRMTIQKINKELKTSSSESSRALKKLLDTDEWSAELIVATLQTSMSWPFSKELKVMAVRHLNERGIRRMKWPMSLVY